MNTKVWQGCQFENRTFDTDTDCDVNEIRGLLDELD
jgi:hypothetical protein